MLLYNLAFRTTGIQFKESVYNLQVESKASNVTFKKHTVKSVDLGIESRSLHILILSNRQKEDSVLKEP